MILKIILGVFILPALISCSGKNDQAFNRGFIAFKMGKEVWVTSKVSAYYTEHKFNLTGYIQYPSTASQESFSILLGGKQDTKNHYTMNAVNHFKFTRIANSVSDLYFDSNETHSAGQVTINKIDTVSKTISGSFEGWVIVNQAADTIKISNGIFSNIPFSSEINMEDSKSGIFAIALN